MLLPFARARGFRLIFLLPTPTMIHLVYSLCTAYNGGGQGNQTRVASIALHPIRLAPPLILSLPYNCPYSGCSPLGPGHPSIRTKVLFPVLRPAYPGQYVVTGCIYEYRNGVLINVHRKDIHLTISDCNPLKALLNPDYDYCDDYLVTFKNEQVNPTGSIYIWKYGDGTKTDTSLDPVGLIQHQFADTGTYT